jgi:hypothetical protein
MKPFPMLLVQAQLGIFKTEQPARDKWQKLHDTKDQEMEEEKANDEAEAMIYTISQLDTDQEELSSQTPLNGSALKKSFDKTLMMLEIMASYDQPAKEVDTISRALLTTLEVIVFKDTQVFEYDYMKQLILNILCSIVEKRHDGYEFDDVDVIQNCIRGKLPILIWQDRQITKPTNMQLHCYLRCQRLTPLSLATMLWI